MSLLQTDKYNFIRITKLFLSSSSRENGKVNEYRLRLPTNIPNVIGASLSAYSLPESLLPSFIQDKSDSFDFRLTSGDNTGVPISKVFTVRWPTDIKLKYSKQETIDYTYILQNLLREAIFEDSVFGPLGVYTVTFNVEVSDFRKTVIRASGTSLDSFELLFATGPSQSRSAHIQMGFDKADYAADMITTFIGRYTYLQSPKAVSLTFSRSVDVFIKEFSGDDLFARVYIDTDEYVTEQNSQSRVRILQTPIRLLQNLHFRLEVSQSPINEISENEHEISLVVYSLAEEVEVPEWVLQSFTL